MWMLWTFSVPGKFAGGQSCTVGQWGLLWLGSGDRVWGSGSEQRSTPPGSAENRKLLKVPKKQSCEPSFSGFKKGKDIRSLNYGKKDSN